MVKREALRSNSVRTLSELEGVCLGIVYKQQPCTAYHVRSELKQAPSSHWQASAGSLYPLLARLEKDGLVETSLDDDDGRGRKLLKITATGRKELRNWVLAGSDQTHISSVTDPVRSRTFFLQILAAPKRRKYLHELVKQMQAHHLETKAHLEKISERDDLFNYLGALGAVSITAARLDWLRLIEKRLAKI